MSGSGSSARGSRFRIVVPAALLILGLCGALSLLVVFRVPIGLLWLPTLLLSTWGHVFALGTLLLVGAFFLSRSVRASRPGRLAGVVGLAAVVIAVSPAARQFQASRELPGQLSRMFGAATPKSLPGAPQRPAPVVLTDLLGVASPRVGVRELEYSVVSDEELRLDLYVTSDAPSPRPTVVMVHGGGWTSGRRSDFPELTRYLAARGYAVADIDYRLAPRSPFPAPVEDVLAAVAYLKDHAGELGLDPTRIALLGRSAGGQIALTAAYVASDPAVRGVVAFYAPTDMFFSWENSRDDTYIDGRAVLATFLGGPPDQVSEQYRRASPLLLADEHSPPTLLLHGSRDVLVFPVQSRRLATRLQELGVPQLCVEIPGATHGFDIAFASPAGQMSTYAIERFLACVLEK